MRTLSWRPPRVQSRCVKPGLYRATYCYKTSRDHPFSVDDLVALQRVHEQLHIRVLGLASIAHDVTPELALATIASLHVLGALHASPAVKVALAGRTT